MLWSLSAYVRRLVQTEAMLTDRQSRGRSRTKLGPEGESESISECRLKSLGIDIVEHQKSAEHIAASIETCDGLEESLQYINVLLVIHWDEREESNLAIQTEEMHRSRPRAVPIPCRHLRESPMDSFGRGARDVLENTCRAYRAWRPTLAASSSLLPASSRPRISFNVCSATGHCSFLSEP